MKSKKFASILCLVLVVCMVFGACSSGTPSSSTGSGSTGTTKDTLVYGINQEPTTMDPMVAVERLTYLPVHAIHDTLVFEGDDRELKPGLAESWTVSEDGLTYDFKIRENVKFHNGDILSVDDVIFSLETLRTTQSSTFSVIKSVSAGEENHVIVELEYPFSPFVSLLILPFSGIVNKASYESQGAEAYGRNPVGTGPFKFKSWMSGDNIVLERFDDYWQGPAALKTITFQIVAEESTMLIGLQSGEIDCYNSASFTNKKIIEDDPNLVWMETPAAQIFTLAFNNGDKPGGVPSIFKDNKALRLAVVYSINKENVTLGAIDGAAPPTDVPYPSFVANYPEDFKGLGYDLDKAKEYLKEAGYENGVTIKMKTTTAPSYARPAEAIMGEVAKIGITLDLETIERGTYLQEVYGNFDYDWTVWAVSCDYPDADHGAYKRMYSGMISPQNNYMQINDPDLDEAIMTNRTSTNNEEKAAAVLKIAEIFRDEAYGLPLYNSPQTMAANANLKGVNINYGMVVDFYKFSW